MDNFNKQIKNKNGTVDNIIVSSNDGYNVMIGDNYKLMRFSGNRKTFKDSVFGTDIGVHSKGFASVLLVSALIALITLALMYLSFRI